MDPQWHGMLGSELQTLQLEVSKLFVLDVRSFGGVMPVAHVPSLNLSSTKDFLPYIAWLIMVLV